LLGRRIDDEVQVRLPAGEAGFVVAGIEYGIDGAAD
jgi:transcription elongation GreA/GreB family factor